MMNINFKPALKEALNNSKREAIHHNGTTVFPPHLLMSLMRDPAGKGFKLIERLASGTSAYRLQQELDEYLFTASLDVATPSVDQMIGADAIKMSSTAYRLVRLAVLEARMLKSEDIDVEHLLLAIFHNNEKSNADFLAPFISAGVTYNALYSALNENPARLGGAEAAYGAGAGDDVKSIVKHTACSAAREFCSTTSPSDVARRSSPAKSPLPQHV